MYLTHLSLTNFRTYSRLDMDMPRRILLLVGDNAQGKTSLLEAIYYLATFTSFHAASDRQLINFLASSEESAVAHLNAVFQRNDGVHRLEVRLIQEANGTGGTRMRKEIRVDGVKRNVHEALGNFNAVIFLPQMMRIVEEGPEERRRYLNLTLSQAIPGYSQALSQYTQGLSQRNALLKQLAERNGDAEQLTYWDRLLAEFGAFIIHSRIQVIQELERSAVRIHSQLTHGHEVLRLVYQPAYDPLNPEGLPLLPLKTPAQRSGFSVKQIQQGFTQRLLALHSEEIERGVTTIGPHRDELRFLCNGMDISDYGSRGQVRTVLLALKLAEVTWLRDTTKEHPVLLLDEILAELDTHRRADLLGYLQEGEQALLTTTDLKLFAPEFVQSATLWNIQDGQVLRRPTANNELIV